MPKNLTRWFLILKNVIKNFEDKMREKIKIFNLFNHKLSIYILVIQLFTIVFIFQTTINKLQHSPNIRIKNYIQILIKFVNVLTIGKRNKYIFVIGKNKFV